MDKKELLTRLAFRLFTGTGQRKEGFLTVIEVIFLFNM
jgi:hypothetical protein